MSINFRIIIAGIFSLWCLNAMGADITIPSEPVSFEVQNQNWLTKLRQKLGAIEVETLSTSCHEILVIEAEIDDLQAAYRQQRTHHETNKNRYALIDQRSNISLHQMYIYRIVTLLNYIPMCALV